jgi:Na+/H+ antiporter NhaA
MFIADLSYSGIGETGAVLLNEAKLGVLCASVLSALLGCWLLNKFLPNEKQRFRAL